MQLEYMLVDTIHVTIGSQFVQYHGVSYIFGFGLVQSGFVLSGCFSLVSNHSQSLTWKLQSDISIRTRDIKFWSWMAQTNPPTNQPTQEHSIALSWSPSGGPKIPKHVSYTLGGGGCIPPSLGNIALVKKVALGASYIIYWLFVLVLGWFYQQQKIANHTYCIN